MVELRAGSPQFPRKAETEMSIYAHCRSVCVLALLPMGILAQSPQGDVPLKHWAAPQYFQTTRVADAALVTSPLTLVAVTPCRLADTRAGSGYPALGSTPLPALTPQTLAIAGACGTPSSGSPALAYSLSVSVVPPVGTRGGYLTVYPNPASPAPLAASLTWNPGETYLTNSAVVVAASPDGSVNILASFPTDVVVDINGYYTAQTSTPRNASLVFNAGSMTAYPASASATALQNTLISGVNSSLSFPATAWAIKPSSSINLMLSFNAPVDFSTAAQPVVHIHFLTGPGTASGTVVLPMFVCSAGAITGILGGCFTGYPNAVPAIDATANGSYYTFNHYDLAYTLNSGIGAGNYIAITLGRSTSDSFGDWIYITSIEFRYSSN